MRKHIRHVLVEVLSILVCKACFKKFEESVRAEHILGNQLYFVFFGKLIADAIIHKKSNKFSAKSLE